MIEAKSIKVLKFGGTSVKSPQRLAHVAQIVSQYCGSRKTIVVVSAMGQHTDSLVELATRCSAKPDRRELDVLLSCGEQQTIALLSIILKDLGVKAKSFTGTQLGIVTEANYGNAEIVSIDKQKILESLEENDVIVVAGFQGVTTGGDITTLGRGGSDTSAVAIAAAVGAKECEIYTDVDGVFSADPNIINGALQHDAISYEECLELAASGAQVIHPRAVECARENALNVRIRNVFNVSNRGTLVCQEINESRDLAGLALSSGYCILEVKIDSSVVDSQTVDNRVRETVGSVNVSATREIQCSSVRLIYLLSGFNRNTGQVILDNLSGLCGVVDARLSFGISKLTLVGRTATQLVNEIYPSLQTLCYQMHPLVFTGSDLTASVFIEESRSLEVWNLLHESFKPKFIAKSRSDKTLVKTI